MAALSLLFLTLIVGGHSVAHGLDRSCSGQSIVSLEKSRRWSERQIIKDCSSHVCSFWWKLFFFHSFHHLVILFLHSIHLCCITMLADFYRGLAKGDKQNRTLRENKNPTQETLAQWIVFYP
ncbi:uncharacterized protein BP01DRAFT_178879 [Aspergillus saccharolyticus JOP 1030-1]|uniref:Secreted protein n=1 Tax=Aspergillus saccharolyticus JOP 1030-1 TaxID=1450539 RepID=A0A318ZKX2_9EURO|nr:hypothetical protein BP01DRAFT_178879 [Aspergillus saccharolyticus JOP 1030-1]PYH48251.1 hypothetical protein BP01DRAFT_178879 [Aspergillus saccharolyticus JOP 1030-1]